MTEATYNEPSLTLNRIYTRGGDKGKTSLVGGQRVEKDSARLECYGTVDELNSFIGVARVSAEEHAQLAELATILKRVQHELFNLGSILATLAEDVHPKQPRVTTKEVLQLEMEIDRMNAPLPALKSFVLPGSPRASAELHVCRTVCRRAERLTVTLEKIDSIPPEAVIYLNRLSDALFVWSRWVNYKLDIPETLWQPNAASSGS